MIPIKYVQVSGINTSSVIIASTRPPNSNRFFLILLVSAIEVGCASSRFKTAFYERDQSEWPVELKKLPIKQQWEIYLYGVRTQRPPPFELAVTLAYEKEKVVPFVDATLQTSTSRSDLNAANAVLKMMKEVVHFDFCGDPPYHGKYPAIRPRAGSVRNPYSC